MHHTTVLNFILIVFVLLGCVSTSSIGNKGDDVKNIKEDKRNSNRNMESLKHPLNHKETLHHENLEKEKETEKESYEDDADEEETEQELLEAERGIFEKGSLKEPEILNPFYFMNDLNDEKGVDDSVEFEETLKNTKSVDKEEIRQEESYRKIPDLDDGLHTHEDDEHTLDHILSEEMQKQKMENIQMDLPMQRKLKDESQKEHGQGSVDLKQQGRKNGPVDLLSNTGKQPNVKINSTEPVENIRKENKKDNKGESLSKTKSHEGTREVHKKKNKPVITTKIPTTKRSTTSTTTTTTTNNNNNYDHNDINNNDNNNNDNNNHNNDNNNNSNNNEKIHFEELHTHMKQPTVPFENNEKNKSEKIKVIKPEYIKELFDILHEVFLIIRLGFYYRIDHFVIPLKDAILSGFLNRVDLFFLTLQSVHKTGSSQYRDLYGFSLLIFFILFLKYLLNKCFQTSKRKTVESNSSNSVSTKQGETVYMENLLKRILFNLEKKKKEGNLDGTINDILENTENILVNMNIINKENKNMYTDMITNINNIGVYTYISTQALKKINTKTDTIINELTTHRLVEDADFDPLKNNLSDRLDEETDLNKMSRNLINDYTESEMNKMKYVDSPMNDISSSGLNDFLKKTEESEYEHPGLKDCSQSELLNKSNQFLKNNIGMMHKRNIIATMNNMSNINNMNNEFDYMNVERNKVMNKSLEASMSNSNNNNTVPDMLGTYKDNAIYSNEVNQPNTVGMNIETNMDMNANMNISRMKSGSSKKLSINEANQRNIVKPPFALHEYKDTEGITRNPDTNFYDSGIHKMENNEGISSSVLHVHSSVTRNMNNTNDASAVNKMNNSIMINNKELYGYENEVMMNQEIMQPPISTKKKSVHEQSMDDDDVINSKEDKKSSIKGNVGLTHELPEEKIKKDSMINKSSLHNYMKNPEEPSLGGIGAGVDKNIGMNYPMKTSSNLDSLNQSTTFSYLPPTSQVSDGTTNIRGNKYVTQRKERQKIVATKSPFS